jgi:hypothetical protein
MFTFPQTRPDSGQSAPMVWTIQNELLARAESMLGSRNQSKKVYQPIFRSDGPVVVNTPNFDGAFAALSLDAAGYWPTVVYELAHETVHLLDPIAGHTNWLEEGAAVEFSVLMSQSLTSHAMEPASASNYALARSLVAQLPATTLSSIGLLRQRFGALSSITADQIQAAFPNVPEDIAIRLASPCRPR